MRPADRERLERREHHEALCRALNIPATAEPIATIAHAEALMSRCRRAEEARKVMAADVKRLTESRDRWRAMAETLRKVVESRG